MAKYIVIMGGVMSGVGKGVTTASIGKILKENGFKVTAIKIDPYINYDAGTLRPTEHGEVWVTDDGGEIDQDLGTYERFFDVDIPKKNNMTTGQIYKTVIDKEREGKYLGETVQFIPHITDEIRNRIKEASENFDFVLIELGGTVGDHENIPFLFAIKGFEREVEEGNVVYVLVTYLPIPRHVAEMKTKPTQQAIRLLSESGIFPDFIICRAKEPLDSVRKKKIEKYANINLNNIISEPDINTTIYQIPLDLEKENLGEKILKKFNLTSKKTPNWDSWKKLINAVDNSEKKVKVAIVGKYLDIGDYSLTDSYLSIKEALIHAGAQLNSSIEITWLDSKSFEEGKNLNSLDKIDGIIIPGGFGSGGVEGKINAINYARLNKIPFLGLCYGMQIAVIEFTRNVCKMENANATEVNKETKYPVIDIIPSQKEIIRENRYGGTMRLGSYAAILDEESQVKKLYEETRRLEEDTERIKNLTEEQKFRLGINNGSKTILERHRHRYEINPKYVEEITKNGLIFSGHHIREDNTKLMEFIELPNHPFFIGTQGHPEFKSRFGNPSPLFYGFLKACIEKTN